MNKVILMGRLTRDPDIRWSQGQDQTCTARYTLAVDRKVRKQEGQQTADFIACVAFGKAGEFVEKYFKKGMRVAVTGHLHTGSYTNRDGQKVYTTDVVIEEQEFAENKREENTGQAAAAYSERTQQKQEPEQRYEQGTLDGFTQVPESLPDEELPFT